MKALSLFTGCGGLDLAAEASGIEVVGQCEIDEYCSRVLEYWWPNVPRWKDVRDVTADSVYKQCRGIDLLFGGPPCQPVSVAGRRRAAGDSRNLWPEFIRVIREIRPQWVVAENPTGIISAQKIKGDPDEWPKGEFFGEIVREITALGYSVGWGVWGACDVENDESPATCEAESGACVPHTRERVFLVAYAESQQLDRPMSPRGGRHGFADDGAMGDSKHHGSPASTFGGCHAEAIRRGEERPRCAQQSPRTGASGMLPGESMGNTFSLGNSTGLADSQGRQERHPTEPYNRSNSVRPMGDTQCRRWSGEPRGRSGPESQDGHPRDGRSPQPGVGGGADGVPARLDFPGWPAGRGAEQYHWEPPRVVPGKSVTGRTGRIKMLGNAVVPAQTRVLFEAIVRCCGAE